MSLGPFLMNHRLLKLLKMRNMDIIYGVIKVVLEFYKYSFSIIKYPDWNLTTTKKYVCVCTVCINIHIFIYLAIYISFCFLFFLHVKKYYLLVCLLVKY